mgnify:CR=1 FL=1
MRKGFISFNAAQYSEVKIVMHSCKTQGRERRTDGRQWQSLRCTEARSKYRIQAVSHLRNRYIRRLGKKYGAKILRTEAKKTQWTGAYYPSYVDIDLEEKL